MKTTSVMIVGVGGQGSLLASKLLGNLLTEEGSVPEGSSSGKAFPPGISARPASAKRSLSAGFSGRCCSI